MWRRRRPELEPLTAQEWNDVVRMLMRMEAKLDRIIEELEIDDGEAEA